MARCKINKSFGNVLEESMNKYMEELKKLIERASAEQLLTILRFARAIIG